MTKRKGEPTNILDTLKEFKNTYNLQEGLNKVDVKHAWKNVMGTGVNNYTQSVTLKQKTLYVTLTSSTLREELNYGKEKIIVLINDSLQEPLIDTLVLR